MRKLIIVKDQADLEQKFLQLVHITIKTRKAQVSYKNNYFLPAKENKEYWEMQMDNFIDTLNMKEDHRELKELDLQIQNKQS